MRGGGAEQRRRTGDGVVGREGRGDFADAGEQNGDGDDGLGVRVGGPNLDRNRGDDGNGL